MRVRLLEPEDILRSDHILEIAAVPRDAKHLHALSSSLGGADAPALILRFPYSHSIVEGGLDEMSRATRFTAGISLMIRLEIVSRRS
jgi:hypothetical protein